MERRGGQLGAGREKREGESGLWTGGSGLRTDRWSRDRPTVDKHGNGGSSQINYRTAWAPNRNRRIAACASPADSGHSPPPLVGSPSGRASPARTVSMIHIFRTYTRQLSLSPSLVILVLSEVSICTIIASLNPLLNLIHFFSQSMMHPSLPLLGNPSLAFLHCPDNTHWLFQFHTQFAFQGLGFRLQLHPSTLSCLLQLASL